jgi:hypothetical protein
MATFRLGTTVPLLGFGIIFLAAGQNLTKHQLETQRDLTKASSWGHPTEFM